MLILRPEQRLALLNDLRARRNNELAKMICDELLSQANEIIKNYDPDKIEQVVFEVIDQCHSRDIVHADQILNLCYIRFITNADVFSMDAFSDLLNDDLMHPYAKARHLIMSFFEINNLVKGQ